MYHAACKVEFPVPPFNRSYSQLTFFSFEFDGNLHTNTHKQTEKVIRGTLPSYAIRYEEAFFPWKTKKRLSAARFALLLVSGVRL